MSPAMPEDFDLKKLRQDANLTQTDLATRLGVTQSQVQRYEQEPDNVPLRIVREWWAACGNPSTASPPEFGTPYAAVEERLRLLESYAANQPSLTEDDTLLPPIGIEDLITAIREIGCKPRLVLCGRFDAGKSRFANTLLGTALPAAYQPTTRVVCLIRHTEAKPAWQAEPVWIMDDTFKLVDADNREECERHRLLAGDFETLRRVGTHSLDRADRDANATVFTGRQPGVALIYVNAPMLLACDLIDTPGLGNSEDDDTAAGLVTSYADAVVYMSPITGFINADDIRAVSTLLDLLPTQPDEAPFARMLFLASHAHPGISDAELGEAFERGATRLANEIRRMLELRATHDRNEATVTRLDAAALRRRMCSWYVETPSRRRACEAELRRLLTFVLPEAVNARLNNAAAAFRAQSDAFCMREVAVLRRLIGDRKSAERELAALLAQEPARKQRIGTQRSRGLQLIAQLKAETKIFVTQEILPSLEEEALRAFIDGRFTDSKEAQQQAGYEILSELRLKIERNIEEKGKLLGRQVDALLAEYDVQFGDALDGITIPFDAQAVFLGSLASLGTFGALAGWATIVAGGSNLGAYLLVPQVVSLLARLGIGIAGGTATGVSIVSALGGPVGIGIGIAITVGVIAWQLLGRSWQSRLARQLHDAIQDAKLNEVIRARCDACWDETANAFDEAAAKTEAAHLERIARLKGRIGIPKEMLQARVDRIEARRTFLSFLPWMNLGDNTP